MIFKKFKFQSKLKLYKFQVDIRGRFNTKLVFLQNKCSQCFQASGVESEASDMGLVTGIEFPWIDHAWIVAHYGCGMQ